MRKDPSRKYPAARPKEDRKPCDFYGMGITKNNWGKRMRDKSADFRTTQNSRFSKQDKMGAVTANMLGPSVILRGSYLLHGSVASLPSPSSNIEAWPYGTWLHFASLLHLGH